MTEQTNNQPANQAIHPDRKSGTTSVIELRTTSGSRLPFLALSDNRGIVYVSLFGKRNHLLISDLDEESQRKIEQIIIQSRAEIN